MDGTLYAGLSRKTFGFKAYQFARIYSWLDPYSYSSSDGYHLITSLNAIGSGEIFGKGFRNREVYVAENHTDFILQLSVKNGALLVLVLLFVFSSY